MKKEIKKILPSIGLFFFLIFILMGAGDVFSQSAHRSEVVGNLPHVSPRIRELPRPREIPFDMRLSPCPNPEREPQFIWRENVVHEERQFRAEHPGCGGDILMRKWQIVGLEMGTCYDLDTGPCENPTWHDEYVAYYDRYVPEERGVVFEEVGSWQKAWPPSDGGGGTNPEDAWRTESQLMEEYGEPVPFPTCQSDCLQAPPGVPGQLGDYDQEDPYYFNNPWLPEMSGGEIPANIEYFREEKNVLGGENALETVPLPAKLFWWNVPGWHDGWIEDNELRECEGPEDIACVNSYIVRFDNINREDRPPKLYRHQTVYEVKEELLNNYPGEYDEVEAYKRAQKIFEDLDRAFHEAYEEHRRHTKDTRSLDVLRYDRDNIMHCDECGGELEIWLDRNTFNPLDYDPIMDYEREHRDWMRDYLLDELEDKRGHIYQEVTEREQEDFIDALIEEEFASYGRPAFFRSGAEHSYSLQAACSPHDYLERSPEMERGEGRWGPRATFSFLAHDGPELISPLDPNWVSPYAPKDYEPNHNESRVRAGEDHEHYENERVDGYRYPAEISGGIREYPEVGDPVEPTIPDPISDHIQNPSNPGTVIVDGEEVERKATDGKAGARKTDGAGNPTKEALSYQEFIVRNTSTNVGNDLAYKIVHAGGARHIPPEDYWPNILPTAEIIGTIDKEYNTGTVYITSAYRPLAYNRSIGSSDGSQHVQNTAIDFHTSNTTTRQLHNLVLNLRDNQNMFTGGVGVYQSSGFIHVDTRGYDANWGGQHAMQETDTLEAGQPASMTEEIGLSDLDPEQMKNLWDENFGDLVFQNLVPFREELEWAQIWYHQDPDRDHHHPATPAAMYQISFGESYRVTADTMSRFGEPVLEWCHTQMTKTFKGRPICDYFRSAVAAGEQVVSYAMPVREDRTIEYFFLPDDDEDEEAVYTWSVAACRDSAENYCTNYSQMWRFQIDENEKNRLFAPRNLRPANIKLDQIEDDEGTVGFPFHVEWDRHFGVETYVYRLREEGGSWDSPLDAAVQRRREVRYDLDDLDDIFDLNEVYEWDVKACWDERVDHGLSDPQEILNWAEEEKSGTCTNWRSEDFDDAPFQFRTTGRPPEEDVYPEGGEEAEYPINFEWESVPGAKTYAFLICEEGLGSGTCGIINPEGAEVGVITPETDFEYLLNIHLDKNYSWWIYSCADEIDETELYFPSSPYFDLQIGNPLSEFTQDAMGLHCNVADSGIYNFSFSLPGPDNLRPGNEDSDDPEIILLEDSLKTINWEKIKGVDYYKVNIRPAGQTTTDSGVAYATEYDFPGEELIEGNNLTYDFADLGMGVYELEVRGCLNPSSVNPEECASGMLGDPTTKYVEVAEMVPDYESGWVRGIIPCGTRIDNPNLEEIDTTEDCRPIHLFVMFALIIEEILIKLIIPFSLVILLIYTGYLYYTGTGDPETMSKVFSTWEYALKGYLLILLAWVIVSVFLIIIGYNIGIFGEWWEITDNI